MLANIFSLCLDLLSGAAFCSTFLFLEAFFSCTLSLMPAISFLFGSKSLSTNTDEVTTPAGSLFKMSGVVKQISNNVILEVVSYGHTATGKPSVTKLTTGGANVFHKLVLHHFPRLS